MVASNGCMAKKLIVGFLGRDSRPRGRLGKRYSRMIEPDSFGVGYARILNGVV